MTDESTTGERWMEGKSALFVARKKRVDADKAARAAGRKIIRASEVEMEFEAKNGVWHSGLVSRDQGFDNRIIEFDTHLYPPGSVSTTHKHNEAVIFILKGTGFTLLDDEKIEWGPGDTLYIPAGGWHQHHIDPDAPALVVAAKPLPLQEYLGELNIVYKGDEPVRTDYELSSFVDEFGSVTVDDGHPH